MALALETTFRMERLQRRGKATVQPVALEYSSAPFPGRAGQVTLGHDHCPSFFRDDKTEMLAFLVVFRNVKRDKKDIQAT